MKHIILSGRLVADPEYREVGDQKTRLTTFTVANNDGVKEGGEFFDVRCWAKTADYAYGHLKKGSKVVIAGSFDNERYKDSEGKNRTHFSIVAGNIEFL